MLENLKRMTKQDKESLLDKIAAQLLFLVDDAEESGDIVFILDKWNTVYIGGNEYALKLERRDK